MSADARPWFPPGTLELASVRRAVAGHIERWSARWFAQGHVRLHRIRPADAIARRPDDGPARHCGGSRICATLRGGDLLAALVLDLDAAEARPTPTDRTLLAPFVDEMLDDLLNGLKEIASPAPFGDPAATIELSDGGGRVLCSIHLDRASIVALVKAALPSQRSARSTLSSRAEALAPTRVALEMRVGGAEVPIHALRALGPGDILVLDRAIAQGLDVAFPGAPRGFAHVALKAREDRTEIHFTQKIG